MSQQCLSRPKNVTEAVEAGLEIIKRDYPLLYHAYAIHRTHDGKILNFINANWQIDILKDLSPIVYIKKSSQCGVSLLMLALMFYLAKSGVSGLYILPTDTWKNTFVPNRIDLTIESVPEYRAMCVAKRKDSDNKSMKTLYGRNWKIIGSVQRNNFYEFPAGAFLVDENDLCDQGNIGYAFDRLGAETDPIVRRFGNPSIANSGIDALYSDSKSQKWMIQCESCNEWQVLDWWTNFVNQNDDGSWSLKDKNGLCCKCDKPLDRLQSGAWVAEHPEHLIGGYDISKLFADKRTSVFGIDPMDHLFNTFVAAQGNPTELQRFYNNDLGLAYDAPGSKITPELLEECSGDFLPPQSSVDETIAGVDVGSRLHLNISIVLNGKRKKIFVGTVADFDELSYMVKRYNVCCGVIDAMPETHKVKEFLADHPGWYKCEYHRSDKTDDYTINYVTRTVKIDRTQSLDASFQMYMDGNVILPKNWKQLDNGDFEKQMVAPTRVFQEPKGLGVGRYVWDEGSKADHHRHSDNYENIAKRIYGGGGSVVTVV